jgi:endogenous inhibitor of DNA gyrase (YacG/DUF329 family)
VERAANKLFPFCSERCQLADLGRWLAGDYRIAGEPDPKADGAEHAAPGSEEE